MQRQCTNGQILEIELRRGHPQLKPHKPLGPTMARGLGGERKKNLVDRSRETTQEGPRKKRVNNDYPGEYD